ncbi:Uncharacterised protein [Serratia plymuthica]|uniref:Uncharacterized protein n=1 Tax=Serratia plymuthica TaxID=82996 RepID=A0A2X4TQ03_SERPL|nr:Uncharacterised protein [Serratia plymuthica]
MHLAFAANNQFQLLGQGVNNGDTHAVQAAGYLVGVVVKFAAGMQHGHDDLRRRNPFLFVNTGRDTTAVILYRNGVIGMDDHLNVTTVARECFVDSVVHNLEYHVVQTGAIIGVADIHARALTHRIQPF